MDISMDDVSEISQCASSISRDDVGIVHSSTTDESETNKVTNTAVSSNESVCTENLEMNDENVLTENKSEASFINEGVGIVYSSSNDEYETNKVANTVVKSYENVFTENLEMNDEIMHTENKPETILEIGHESFTNEEVGLDYCSDNDESKRNIVSNDAVRSNEDGDSENLELNYEKVLFESEPEASSDIHHKSFENEELSETEQNDCELQEETPHESPDLFYYSLPKPQKYNSFKQAVAKELEICEKSSTCEKRTPILTPQQKNGDENIIDLGIFDEPLLTDISKDTSAINPGSNRMKDENIIDLGIFDESLLADNSKDTSAINPGSNRMKGQTPSSTAAYSPACPSRSMRASSSFMSVSNPEEFPKRSQVNCKDSSVTETPGAKHRMLKEDLMEKMKRSKEQKFKRQKEMETMDNEEEFDELPTTEEADSSPDSEVENANADCDPIEGAKHRTLKKDLVKKRKLSEEQKFQRRKEIEAMYNGEACELPTTEEADSSPDSDVKNAHSDCDLIEDPIFSSFPSYQPGGGMKIESGTEASKSDTANDDVYEGCGDSFLSRASFEENKARQILPETMNNGTAEYNTIMANEEFSRTECEDDENGAWSNIFRTPKKFFHSYEDSVENICSGPFATPVEDPLESFASGPLFEDDPIDSLASRSPLAYDLAENLDSRTYDEEVESYAKSFEDDSEENYGRINRPSDDETAPGMKIKLFRKRAKKHRVLSSSDESDEEMVVLSSLNDNTNGDLRSKKRCMSEDSDDEIGHLVNYDGNNEAKRRKTHVIADFIENEAELSGEEASSDENESGEDDEPLEAEPEPEVDVSQKKLMEMHMKHLKDDDDKLEKLIKNDFLDEGEFFNEDNERSRKFRWIAQEAVPEAEKIELSDSEEEAKVNIDTDKLKWQKETEVLKQESAIEADENVLVEPTGGKKYQLKILTKNNISVNEFEARTRRKVKRGSFMSKDSIKDVVNEETSKKIPCNDESGAKEETLKYDS